MKFLRAEGEQLAGLRRDPLLWEQELDVRPAVAEALEAALGARAGEFHWRSDHGHLYGLELADLGRGRPSMARVYGYWDRYEPRPPEHEIDRDLHALCLWVARIAPGLDPADLLAVSGRAGLPQGWPDQGLQPAPAAVLAPLAEFPFEPRRVAVEGLTMAWVEAGQGPCLVLVHGDGSWGYQFRHLVPALCDRYRVLVPDLPGFGRSDRPLLPGSFTLPALARWLHGWMHAVACSRATVVATDQAAAVGLLLAAREAAPVERLLLAEPLLHPRDGGDGFAAWRRACERAASVDFGADAAPRGRVERLTPAARAAYRLPQPEQAQQVARRFPALLPGHGAGRQALDDAWRHAGARAGAFLRVLGDAVADGGRAAGAASSAPDPLLVRLRGAGVGG